MEVYTVVGEYKDHMGEYYQLAERDTDIVFMKHLFIPLSTIDETNFNREYNLEPQKSKSIEQYEQGVDNKSAV